MDCSKDCLYTFIILIIVVLIWLNYRMKQMINTAIEESKLSEEELYIKKLSQEIDKNNADLVSIQRQMAISKVSVDSDPERETQMATTIQNINTYNTDEVMAALHDSAENAKNSNLSTVVLTNSSSNSMGEVSDVPSFQGVATNTAILNSDCSNMDELTKYYNI